MLKWQLSWASEKTKERGKEEADDEYLRRASHSLSLSLSLSLTHTHTITQSRSLSLSLSLSLFFRLCHVSYFGNGVCNVLPLRIIVPSSRCVVLCNNKMTAIIINGEKGESCCNCYNNQDLSLSFWHAIVMMMMMMYEERSKNMYQWVLLNSSLSKQKQQQQRTTATAAATPPSDANNIIIIIINCSLAWILFGLMQNKAILAAVLLIEECVRVMRRIIICNREKERELQQHVEVLFFGKCTEGNWWWEPFGMHSILMSVLTLEFQQKNCFFHSCSCSCSFTPQQKSSFTFFTISAHEQQHSDDAHNTFHWENTLLLLLSQMCEELFPFQEERSPCPCNVISLECCCLVEQFRKKMLAQAKCWQQQQHSRNTW